MKRTESRAYDFYFICHNPTRVADATMPRRFSLGQRMEPMSNYGTSTRRRPKVLNRAIGDEQLLVNTRHRLSSMSQHPPRKTREEPLDGPVGLICELLSYLPYQSLHHSHTLPDISYKPSSFGDFVFTQWVLLFELPSCHPTASILSLPEYL